MHEQTAGGQALEVARDWRGELLTDPAANFVLRAMPSLLTVEWSAPFHGDPPPKVDPRDGPCAQLWTFEVVELFLLSTETRNYLELEWGPYGHWLALRFGAPRQALRGDEPALRLAPKVWRGNERWGGQLQLSASQLPPALTAVNAYAIHGPPGARRYCAHRSPLPVPERPDFHDLRPFAALDADLLSTLGPCGAAWPTKAATLGR